MKCRICDKEIDKPFLSLGNMPLSNSLVTDPLLEEKYYPLDVYLCPECYFIQTPEFDTASAKAIFSEGYPYFSSYSETWLNHCKNYVDMIMDRYLKNLDKENESSLVIEIGSNDGHLLQYFKPYNVKVLGIEPAGSVANAAIKRNVPTDIKYFDREYAINYIKNGNKKADLIIGNNVLPHNPNLHDFVEGLKIVLKENGIITIEFPYLLNLIQQNQFDTIYHEHFSYFSLFSVIRLFQRHRLIIFDVEEIPTHGGSLRIYVKHKENSTIQNTNNISNLIKKENRLYNVKTYIDFGDTIKLIKMDLIKILMGLKKENKRIVGYGAPAKGNILLNYCRIYHGIGDNILDYTVDMNPYKQGKYLPGSHIPIKSVDVIKDDKPDYVLILPWNLKDEIMHQLEYTREWGCMFIIPIPMPYIIQGYLYEIIL